MHGSSVSVEKVVVAIMCLVAMCMLKISSKSSSKQKKVVVVMCLLAMRMLKISNSNNVHCSNVHVEK